MKRAVLKTIVFALTLTTLALAPVVRAEQAPVDVYVTAWCPYCARLESFLKENHIQYSRHDIEADQKAAETFEAIGGTGVPVVRVGKEVIYGFDAEGILRSLKAQS